MNAMMKKLDAQEASQHLPVIEEGGIRKINDTKLGKMNAVVQVTQKEFAQKQGVPTESFTTELFWFGNNGMNEGKVMRLYMRRAFVNEINAMVGLAQTLWQKTRRLWRAKITSSPRPCLCPKIGAEHTHKKAIGTQDMMDDAIETDNIENRFKEGDKYSLIPTHPVAVNPKANTQVDNSRGVCLYGKTSDFMSKVLGVPVKALAVHRTIG